MNTLRQDYSISARELDHLLNVTPQGLHHMLKNMDIKTEMKSNKKFISPSEVRKLLESRGYKYTKEILAFSIVKGGVGKTSLSHSFSIRASQYGARVLVIDLDQQANLTQAFGIDDDDLPTFYEVIKNEVDIRDAIIPITADLHIVPSNMNMSFLDRHLQVSQQNLKDVFKDQIDKVYQEYDYVVFDCPPAISSSTAAATLASSRIVIPVSPMKFSISGLRASFEEIANLEGRFKKTGLKKSIIFNRYDGRKVSSSGYMGELAKSQIYSEYMMNCFIRENSDLENCINQKHSIFDYGRKSPAREDLDLFTRELMGLKEETFMH